MQPTSDNILSDILMKTTEVDPMTNTLVMHSLYAKSGFKHYDRAGRFKIGVNKFCTGSVAELRIKTLLSCIGDVDTMYHRLDEIALPPEHQYLPSERLEGMNSVLYLHRIDFLSDYPGYVRLHFDGFLTWNKHTNKYDVVRPRENVLTLSNSLNRSKGIAQGPAIHDQKGRIRYTINGRNSFTDIECDFVKCIRCPFWPSDALDFIDRLKPSGWPSVTLIQEVRKVGCDVVPVAHPDCRPHDTHQWRLSFSRAEIFLVRSWTKDQQMVYHLLRYFIKNSLGPENEIVSNYHLKTIMLWKCEQQDGAFWNESQLIATVSHLISCLLQNLNNQSLRHYFIATCNLFGSRKVRNNLIQCEQLSLKLIPFIDVERLVDWFLEKYLVASYERIPQPDRFKHMHGFRYIADIIKRAVSRERRRERLEELRIKYLEVYNCSKVLRDVSDFELCVNLIMIEFLPKTLIYSPDIFQMYLHTLPQVDVRLDGFFRGFCYLLLAQQLPKLPCVRICPKLINVTLDLIGDSNANEYVHLFGDFQDDSPESYFNKAIFLLRIYKTETAEAELLLALAKACLIQSLESDGELFMFYDAASAYLATMLFSEKQYQLTLDFCESITSKITTYPISNCCRVELKLLPDCHHISVASGFSVLYEYVIRNTSPIWTSNDFTPTLLVYFISARAHMRCQIDTTYTQMLRLVQLYYSFLTKSFQKALLSTFDFCFYGFILSDFRKLRMCSSVSERHSWGKLSFPKRTLVYSRREEASDNSSCSKSFLHNTTIAKQYPSFENLINRKDLIEMYIDMSLGQLTDEYRALNHYRRREYDSALKICVENMKVPNCSGVPCSRPFNLLLDDDLAKIIDRKSDSRVIEVAYSSLRLYLKLRCLLDLQGPGCDIARGIIELNLKKKYLQQMHGLDRAEADIVRFTRERIRTLRTDVIIHGEERVSIKENGLYTTFFVDPQSPGLIKTTEGRRSTLF